MLHYFQDRLFGGKVSRLPKNLALIHVKRLDDFKLTVSLVPAKGKWQQKHPLLI